MGGWGAVGTAGDGWGRYESDASDGSTGLSHARADPLISHTACIATDTKVQTQGPTELSVGVASTVAEGQTQIRAESDPYVGLHFASS